jgi:hypothetical protein
MQIMMMLVATIRMTAWIARFTYYLCSVLLSY